MSHSDPPPRPEVVVHAEASFDAFAASVFGRVLASSSPGSRVILDFSRCHDVYDLGLAVLAHALATSRHVQVVLRGLCHRHERMLQYFGVLPGAPTPARDAAPTS